MTAERDSAVISLQTRAQVFRPAGTVLRAVSPTLESGLQGADWAENQHVRAVLSLWEYFIPKASPRPGCLCPSLAAMPRATQWLFSASVHLVSRGGQRMRPLGHLRGPQTCGAGESRIGDPAAWDPSVQQRRAGAVSAWWRLTQR